MLPGAIRHGGRRLGPVSGAVSLCAAVLIALVAPAAASAADAIEVDAATDGGDPGDCELRDAMVSLNIGGTQDGCVETPIAGTVNEITFNIDPDGSTHTIPVSGSQLVTPSSATEIDGSNDGVGPRITIDASALVSGNGLLISSGGEGSTIRNLIVNGAPDNGVLVDVDDVTLEGLIVGTDFLGSAGIGNGADGVRLRADRATVNDSLISGNGGDGIEIAPLTVPTVESGSGTTITGSVIGLGTDGTSLLPNAESGIDGKFGTLNPPADNVTIGGSDPIAGGCGLATDCNTISGNGGDQIDLSVNGHDPGVRGDGWKITGNYIGTNRAGTAAADPTPYLGPCSAGTNGIQLAGAFAGFEIAGNLISGLTGKGVALTPASQADVSPEDTTIKSNYIGTDKDGTAAVPNQCPGLYLVVNVVNYNGDFAPLSGTMIGGTTDPTPGGVCDGDCNLISGNDSTGVEILGRTIDTSVLGNHVGTDRSGLVALPNGQWGIDVVPDFFAPGESAGTIGSAAAPNVISGNSDSGVRVASDGELPLTIASNRIGVGSNGATAVGNAEDGIELAAGGTSAVTIGGTSATAGNVIANNAGDGVQLNGGATPAAGNPILRNSIFSNGDLGIDLMHDALTSGPDPNGACFGGTQANDCQPFPVVTAVAGGSVAIRGSLFNVDPNSDYRIEFFANPAADPSGYGEGRRYLGSVDVSTGVGPDVSFLFASKAVALADGEYVTATATKLGAGGAPGSTSEFSEAVRSPDCSLTGGPGPNVLTGTLNRDIICGLGGADTLTGGAGPDAIFGGDDNDTIHALDGTSDPLVDCGPGNDTVYADASDVLSGCESVNPVSPPPPPPPADTDPPKLKLSGDKKQKSKKKVVVKAKCKDEACDLKATGTIKIKGKKYDLKKAKKADVAAGKKKKLKLKLKNQAKKKLGKVIKKKKSTAKIKVTATDEAGNATDKTKFEVKVKK